MKKIAMAGYVVKPEHAHLRVPAVVSAGFLGHWQV
jgi:hypothetical protein